MIIEFITKDKVLIIFFFLVIIILFLALNNKNNSNKVDVEKNNVQESIVEYDEETKLYYIRDKETDKIVAANYDKEALQFYIDHPDYLNSDLSGKSSNIKDYVYNDFGEDTLLYNE